MAVKIRLRREGAKHKYHYKVVVADSAKSTDGRFIEIVGHYNPTTEPEEFEVKEDRVSYWLNRGAQPSDSVRTLLTRQGLWQEVSS